MTALFSAMGFRLRRSKSFWCLMAFEGIVGLVIPILNYCNNLKYQQEIPLDSNSFAFVTFMVVLSAVLASLFLGTEHSDGTIRNKIIVGNRRHEIYLANLGMTYLGSLFLCACFLVPYLAVGIPLLGFYQTGIGIILLNLLTAAVLMLALVSIYTAFTMLNQNKAIVVAVCILLSFAILMVGAYVNAALAAPEFLDGVSIDQVTGVLQQEVIPNPRYLRGTMRAVFAFLYDFLPGGQAIALSSMEVASPYRLMAYSLAIALAANAIGIYCFRRKDLK